MQSNNNKDLKSIKPSTFSIELSAINANTLNLSACDYVYPTILIQKLKLEQGPSN